jgi:hypothetical protein
MSESGNKNDLEKYFNSTLEHMVSAGHGIKEFSEFTLEHLGETVRPHIRNFAKDVRMGVIKVKGITAATRVKILGQHIDEAEREQMIREAAYFLAEKRNFIGGDAETDWYQAEKIVSSQLDEESGLTGKSFKRVEYLSSEIKTKLETVEHDVKQWVNSIKDRAA